MSLRPPLAALEGRRYDVAVVGGGVNGASAAQHLAASGFKVLLVERSDFGSGTSGRSSRMLHCGLTYLAPGASLWNVVRRPGELAAALSMARLAMECRAELVLTMPERIRPMVFTYPMYRDGPYRPWQLDLAFAVLGRFGRAVPLEYRRLPAARARDLPLVKGLARPERLHSVAVFREYQYDWPERICLDTLLDAERLGATVANYAAVATLQATAGGGWRVTLDDRLRPGGRATVDAAFLVNTAGPWVDRVNHLAAPATKRVTGVKGVNVMVQLPEDCVGHGMETTSSRSQAFYVMPWGRYHFLGPTETVFEGDPDAVRPLEDEIAFVLAEANRLFPGWRLTRADVRHAWAGVRPRTHIPDGAEGRRAVTVHDLAADGMPNALALTGTPIMVHRHAGRTLAAAVAARLAPSGPAQPLSYAARGFPENRNSPPLDPSHPETRIAHLRNAAEHEHPGSLLDLLLRRVKLGWEDGALATASARRTAEAVADIFGWDEQAIAGEVEAYRRSVRDNFLVEPAPDASPTPARRY